MFHDRKERWARDRRPWPRGGHSNRKFPAWPVGVGVKAEPDSGAGKVVSVQRRWHHMEPRYHTHLSRPQPWRGRWASSSHPDRWLPRGQDRRYVFSIRPQAGHSKSDSRWITAWDGPESLPAIRAASSVDCVWAGAANARRRAEMAAARRPNLAKHRRPNTLPRGFIFISLLVSAKATGEYTLPSPVCAARFDLQSSVLASVIPLPDTGIVTPV